MKHVGSSELKKKRQIPCGGRPGTSLVLMLVLGLILSCSCLFSLECKPAGADTAALKMDKPTLVLRSGASRQLACTLQGQSVQDLKWSSSNQSIAAVDTRGFVTSIAKGTAVITAAAAGGTAAGRSTVIVDRDPLAPLSPIAVPGYQLQNGIYENNGAEKSDQATLMLTGDLMCLIRQQRRARTNDTYNFNASFNHVRNILGKADFAAGNLETMHSHTWPYKIEETRIDGQWNCNAPETYLDALRYAGFDGLLTANNHSCDTGPQGILETLAHLNQYQFLNTGIFAGQDSQRFFLVNIQGIRVAFLSYTCQLNTDDRYFTGDEVRAMVSIYSPEKVARDVAEAKAKGAEFIIAYVHWGRQNSIAATEKQLLCAREMADSGVNYIVGSHPHVLQRHDVITAKDGRRVPVMYSMGNFIGSMDEVVGNRDAIILRVVLKRTARGIVIDSEGYYPCYVVDELNGVSTTVIPTSPRYNTGLSLPVLEQASQRIAEALGGGLEEID